MRASGHGASPRAASATDCRVKPRAAAHLLAGRLPDRQQHALALVVAGAVLVRLAEVAEADRAVDRGEDLAEADLRRAAGEHVAAADAALRPHQPGALQRQQDLLEVRLGDAGALGDVAHRRGPVARPRAAPATAGPGRRSRLCWKRARLQSYGVRTSPGNPGWRFRAAR